VLSEAASAVLARIRTKSLNIKPPLLHNVIHVRYTIINSAFMVLI